MTDKEFPCRTKTITGIIYNLSIWNGLEADGKPSGFTSFNTMEAAQNFIDLCLARGTKFKYEIKPKHWEEEVCIECGKEIW